MVDLIENTSEINSSRPELDLASIGESARAGELAMVPGIQNKRQRDGNGQPCETATQSDSEDSSAFLIATETRALNLHFRQVFTWKTESGNFQ